MPAGADHVAGCTERSHGRRLAARNAHAGGTARNHNAGGRLRTLPLPAAAVPLQHALHQAGRAGAEDLQ